MLQEGAHHWVGLVCFYPESSLSAHSAEVEMRCGGVEGCDPLYRVCRKASEDQVDENVMGPEPMGRCPMVLGSKMRAGWGGPGHPRRGSTMPQGCWGGGSLCTPQPLCLFVRAQAGICPRDPEASGFRAQSWPWGTEWGQPAPDPLNPVPPPITRPDKAQVTC